MNTTSITTIYTVPSGRTAVIRRLTAWARGDANGYVGRLSINGTTSSQRVAEIAAAQASTTELGYFVLDPADVLRWHNPGLAGAYVLTAYGSLLLGEPE